MPANNMKGSSRAKDYELFVAAPFITPKKGTAAIAIKLPEGSFLSVQKFASLIKAVCLTVTGLAVVLVRNTCRQKRQMKGG